MKCTGKRKTRAAALILISLLITGCGTKTYEIEHAYDVYGTQIHYQQEDHSGTDTEQSKTGRLAYFAQNLCVGEDIAPAKESTNVQAAEAVGVFHEAGGDITYSKNIYEKLYPASTTKILTAYIALKYGKLTDVITVSAEAANQLSDSSVCGIHTGDQITLEDLLYGLLLKSGNDAADAIAEYISGDEQAFAKRMNEEAAALGATHSHFVNPHGLQDENHYTCVYDLYLMFHAALQYEEFEKIISTKEHTPAYQDANGLSVTQVWPTTNQFLTGETAQPKGIRVIGGKTGTTNDAGYCLVLYSKKKKSSEPLITIVLKATSRDHLYQTMTELMKH